MGCSMASQQVHPTAIVHANAQIGKDVEIGPYAIIEEHVVIGDRCRIDAHAVIKDYTRMGVGKEGGGGITRIGSRNLCMAYTHIAHDCQLGNDIVMSNGATLGGHVRVDDFAIIGGLSAVHQFGHVGTHAFVGGMTGVAQDLPPWMLAAGSRALVHGPNLVGLRRAGASRETISAFKQAFRLIWRSEMPRSQALDLLANDYANLPQVMEFVDFVRSSERGLCPAEKNVEKKLDDDAV